MTLLGRTQVCITKAIVNFGWLVFLHTLFSPDFTPLGYHVFGPLNESLQGHHYTNDVALQNTGHQWLQRKEGYFYYAAKYALVQ
jgi:hypothetical protein